MKIQQKLNKVKNQTGRSMVEMLGVLAIIGVLSIGGVAGYRYAMERINYNKLLDIYSKFELMYFTEKNNWEDSVYNVADDELCESLTGSSAADCFDFENEYFCDTYAGPFYCKSQVTTAGMTGNGWWGRYAIGSGDVDHAWTWMLTNIYDSNCSCYEVGLRIRISQSYCEEFIMTVYHSALRPYLGWVGWHSGSWYFRSMNESSAQSMAKTICSDTRAMQGSLVLFYINVRWE